MSVRGVPSANDRKPDTGGVRQAKWMFGLVPVLAIICIPLRGLPLRWFWIDFAFAPCAALPLWMALRDIRRVEAAKQAESGICGSES
jgi:hypothetical protein